MYVFENALRNVLRNKGRYLLIGGVILAVIVVTVISLMINNTAGGIIDDYKSRFGAEVLIQPNVDKIREEAMAASTDGRVRIQMPSIEPGMYVDFGNSEYLKSSVYTASTGLVCDGLAAVAEDLGGGGGPVRMGMGGAAGGAAGSTAEGDDAEQQPMSYFMNLLGGQFQEFEDGSRQLADGRMPEALNECIVSADLAELNGISLGDSFEFAGELRSLDMETESETTAPIAYTLTVVGTYHDLTDEYAEGAMQNAYTNRRNEILTTYETVIQEMVSGMNGIRVSGTYYLQDPSMLDAFAAEVYAKGLPETFDVKTD
ncbi:MAG: hypothetical protein LBD12_02885, partial [Clostridiales Family XIII bacterium]|nr:hypothetical protein [Clostridiales Family XIII bacterium]